jgi:hypothetical protein
MKEEEKDKILEAINYNLTHKKKKVFRIEKVSVNEK